MASLPYKYLHWDPERHGQEASTFQRLMDIFQQLLQYTAGDAEEALHWMTQLDQKYDLAGENRGLGEFIDELKQRGYLREDAEGFQITARTERALRNRSLEEVFSAAPEERSWPA